MDETRNGMTQLHFLIGLLFLSGCANSSVEQSKTPWEALKQEIRQCLSDVKNDRELQSIANKVSLDSTYDRDVYFELAGIKYLHTAEEKIAIRKWIAELEPCYKLKVESYTYEPASIAKWSAATDREEQSLLSEFSRGNLCYG